MLRQPLLHFLLFGLLLFIAFHWLHRNRDAAPDSHVIVVDRDALLTFLQYRSKAFNPAEFGRELDAMSEPQRRQAIDELVREEVMYREALALHLDRDDYVIKRRLIQKLEFLTQGVISAGGGPTEQQIGQYYKAHRQDYYVQPSVTFTHVFFDFERRGREQAATDASRTLEELNRRAVPFADSVNYGDRFLYFTNYVERTPDYVAAHFGRQMADKIFQLPADDGRWHGPYQSPYGMHLIRMADQQPGRYPELSEIHDRVRDDAEQDLVRERTEQAIRQIIDKYQVRIRLEPDGAGG